ncbi:MAG TPA: fibronectin type III domain-containing protein [Chthoniobacterales bacterium]
MKLRTGFLSYNAADLLVLADKAVQNATGVAVWVSLGAMLPIITALADALRAAMANSGAGHATIEDNARIALAQQMSAFASAVNAVTTATEDDRVALGLPMAKKPERSGAVPEMQISLAVKPGPASGVVVGSFKHVGQNILIYEAQYTMGDPNTGPWIEIEPFSTSRHFEISNLDRAKDVWVRVRARNSNGPGPWSDPATTLVN